MWRVESMGPGRRAQRCLFLFIGCHYLAWAMTRRGGAPSQAWQIHALDHGSADATASDRMQALVRALEQVNADDHAARLRVVVADNWLATALVPWSTAMQHRHGAMMQARACLTEAGYGVGEDDTIRLDNAPWNEPRLCVAFPQALMQALRQCAQRQCLRLDSVVPLSVAGWSAAQRPGQGAGYGALLVTDEALLLVASARRGHLQGLNWRVGPFVEPVAELSQVFWRRLALRNPALAAVTQVAVLALQEEVAGERPALSLVATARHACGSALDAVVAVHPRTRALAILAALGGMALMAASLWSGARQVGIDADALAARHNGATRQSPPLRPPQRDELARLAAASTAIAQLNRPVLTVLQALAPPPDIPVALQALEWRAAKDNEFRVEARAADVAAMLHYVAYLEHQSALTSATLVRHDSGATPGWPWRFTTQVSWSD